MSPVTEGGQNGETMTQSVSNGTALYATGNSAAASPIKVVTTTDSSVAATESSKSATDNVSSSGNTSPPAEHVTSDVDGTNQSAADTPKSNSPNKDEKNSSRRRRQVSAANTAALLADPASLLELEEVSDNTKKTQCSIPFQRSTFLVVEENKPKTPNKSFWRYEVWNHMEKNNIASTPRPVMRRIPNFKDSEVACEIVAELVQFKNAQVVVIGPDRPQQKLRYIALKENKTLLIPSSRLASGLFNKIVPPENATDEQIALCSTSEGVRTFSKPIGLNDEIKVDLVVMGSTVVSSKGRRLGKGEGFADIEWAMMVAMGAVTGETLVVTCVHDCQIKDDMTDEIFQEFDLPVDVIVTPTQTIYVENKLKKPTGIYWSKLTERKFEKVPVLKQLQDKEKEKGVDVTLALKPSENKDSVSYIDAENEVDKSCQINQRPKRNKPFGRTGGFGARRGAPDPRSRHLKKRRNFQRQRRRDEKSVTEDDATVEGSNKASAAGSGDAATNIVKKIRQRKNQRRQRSLRERNDSKANENDTEGGETSGKGEDFSGPEDRAAASRRRNRRSNRSEGDRNVSESDNRRGRRYNNGYPPFAGRAPPPWFNPYNMPPPPPHGRFNGGFYPPAPPPMRGSRYGYRDQGYYGPPVPPPPFMGGGRRGGPQIGRQNEFYPSSSNLKPAVFVGDIPNECGEDMFSDVLSDRKVKPERMIWQKDESRTFLVFNTLGLAQDCVRKLKNLYINDEACRVDLSNMTKRNYGF